MDDTRSDNESDELYYERIRVLIDDLRMHGPFSRDVFDSVSEDAVGENAMSKFTKALIRDNVGLIVFGMSGTIVTMSLNGCLRGKRSSYEAYLSSPAKNFVDLIRYLCKNPNTMIQVAIATTADFANYFIDNQLFQQPKCTIAGDATWKPSDNPSPGQFEKDFIVDDDRERKMTWLCDDDVKLPLAYKYEPEHYHNMLGGACLVKSFLLRTFVPDFVADTDRDAMTADEKKMVDYLARIIIVARDPAIRAESDTCNSVYNSTGKIFHLKRIVEIHLWRTTAYAKDEMAEAVHNYLWYHTILFDSLPTNVDFASGKKYITECKDVHDFPHVRYCRAFLVDGTVGFTWNHYIKRSRYPLGTIDNFEDAYFSLTLP